MNETWFKLDERDRLVTIAVVKMTPCFLWYKDKGTARRSPRFGWYTTKAEAVEGRRKLLEAEVSYAWDRFAKSRIELDEFKRLNGE